MAKCFRSQTHQQQHLNPVFPFAAVPDRRTKQGAHCTCVYGQGSSFPFLVWCAWNRSGVAERTRTDLIGSCFSLSSIIGELQPTSFSFFLSLSSAHMELGAAPAFVCSGNEEKNISDLCTHLWAITRYTICFSDIPRVRRKKHTKTFASFILRLGKYYGYNSSIHGACNDTQD